MFDKNHGLTPLKNADFLDFKKWSFLQSRKTSLLLRTSIIVISGLIFLKTRRRQNFEFMVKIMGETLQKTVIFGSFNKVHFMV